MRMMYFSVSDSGILGKSMKNTPFSVMYHRITMKALALEYQTNIRSDWQAVFWTYCAPL